MTAADKKTDNKARVASGTQDEKVSFSGKLPGDIGTDYNFKRKIVWKNALGFLALHLAGLYGFYVGFFAHKLTVVWAALLTVAAAEGVTIGAHRLYSHRTFKAKFPFRLILIILQTIAGQNCLYIWVRDHRLHHKYSDTDADPHNANRGFFFSHMGWLMSKKHPAVIEKGKTIDLSDLEKDWLVMFQKEHYKTLYAFFAIALPVAIPVHFWNETYYNSFFVSYMFRNVFLLNATWCVNSYAHFFGTKPFDKNIRATESLFVGILAIGEGWHNYHHTFPWDYRASELGSKYCLTTYVIDFMAYFGQAYDLKSAPYPMIQKRILRTGDGTHPILVKREMYDQSPEVLNEADDEQKYSLDENIVGKTRISLPAMSQRVMAVQG